MHVSESNVRVGFVHHVRVPVSMKRDQTSCKVTVCKTYLGSRHHCMCDVLVCKETSYDVQVSKSNVHVRSRHHEGVRMRGTTQGADDVSEVMTRYEVLGTIQLTIVTVSSRTVKHGLHGQAQCVGSACCVCLQRHPRYT